MPTIVEIRVHSKFGADDERYTVSLILSGGTQISLKDTFLREEAEARAKGIEEGLKLGAQGYNLSRGHSRREVEAPKHQRLNKLSLVSDCFPKALQDRLLVKGDDEHYKPLTVSETVKSLDRDKQMRQMKELLKLAREAYIEANWDGETGRVTPYDLYL